MAGDGSDSTEERRRSSWRVGEVQGIPPTAEEITLQLAQVLPLFNAMADALMRIGKLEGEIMSLLDNQTNNHKELHHIDEMLRGVRGDNGLFSKVRGLEHRITALQSQVTDSHNRTMRWIQGLGIPLILLLVANIAKEFFGA